jgi:hypothetical protein
MRVDAGRIRDYATQRAGSQPRSVRALAQGSGSETDRHGLQALSAFGDFHLYALTFYQIADARALQGSGVNEYLGAPVFNGDKAEPFVGVVPFDGAGHPRGRTAGPSAVRLASCRLRPRERRTLVNLENLADLRALLARPDPDLQRDAGLEGGGIVARLLDNARMQESVACPTVEDDKAETLFRAEPFYGRLGRRPQYRLPAWRRRTKPARSARREILIIEAAPPRFAKTSFTHPML